jgi:integrase
MGKLTFKLRKSTGKTAVIQLFFNYGLKKRFRYSTGLFIQDIKNWKVKDMRIKNVVSEIDRYIVNEKLDDLQSKLNKAYTKLAIEEGKQATDKFFKDFCDEYFNKKAIVDKSIPELLPFYLWFIENYTTKPLTSTGHPLKRSTAKTYKSAYALLLRFNKEGYDVNYDSINFDFYNDYISWLQEDNYSTNYIGNQIKTLKTMMTSSFELDYHKNLEHTKKYFKKPTEKSFSIYLNKEELKQIFECDLSKVEPIIVNKKLKLTPEILNTARDLFLISSNTGLRVSDFSRLQPNNIIIDTKGKKYIQITTQKTDKPLSIPINSIVTQILNKRNGNPPPSLPHQHINYALKEIGKLAGIDSKVTKEITKGGVVLKQVLKKYELMKNHTGRFSFCSNAYYSGMPTIDIMTISGHTSERVFYNYIRVNGMERASKIGEHPFFS